MRIGIDLGGTKTEGIVLSDNNKIIERVRIPTPQNQGYQAIIDNITSIVNRLEHTVNQKCTVGIGTPGSIVKHTGLMKYSNTICLNDQPLLKDLEHSLQRQIRIENDANCFALSEAIDGSGQDHNCVFGIIMGTGVGGGIVINGKILSGPNGMTGEWGHNILHHGGPPCYCGQNGCVETYLSGPGLIKQFKSNGGQNINSVEELIALNESDEIAAKTLDQLKNNFALAISYVIKILDPDIIVLGGGLSNLDYLYENTEEKINHHFLSPVNVNIARNKHGDSSGVRGAALLWQQK